MRLTNIYGADSKGCVSVIDYASEWGDEPFLTVIEMYKVAMPLLFKLRDKCR